MRGVVAVSGAGFKRSVRLGAADYDFSVEGAFFDEFFKESLQLIVYASVQRFCMGV